MQPGAGGRQGHAASSFDSPASEAATAPGTAGNSRALRARRRWKFLPRASILTTPAANMLQNWLAGSRSNPLEPFSMHAPLFPDREMGRAGAPAVNVLHPEKSRRIDAMDEIKRALEAAEHIPFKNLVVHLGERSTAGRREPSSTRPRLSNILARLPSPWVSAFWLRTSPARPPHPST